MWWVWEANHRTSQFFCDPEEYRHKHCDAQIFTTFFPAQKFVIWNSLWEDHRVTILCFFLPWFMQRGSLSPKKSRPSLPSIGSQTRAYTTQISRENRALHILPAENLAYPGLIGAFSGSPGPSWADGNHFLHTSQPRGKSRNCPRRGRFGLIGTFCSKPRLLSPCSLGVFRNFQPPLTLNFCIRDTNGSCILIQRGGVASLRSLGTTPISGKTLSE